MIETFLNENARMVRMVHTMHSSQRKDKELRIFIAINALSRLIMEEIYNYS